MDGEVVAGMLDYDNSTMSVAAACADGALYAVSNAVDAAAVTSLTFSYVIPHGTAGVLEIG